MIKYSLIILAIICFNPEYIKGQNNTTANKCYKYQICSKTKSNLASEVSYYNSKIKSIRTSIGLSNVNGCYKVDDDSIKQASIISKGYYPIVIDIDPKKKYPKDTVFLNRVSKDSIYTINAFKYDSIKRIDLKLSKAIIDTYCTFFKSHNEFNFKLICFRDDKATIDNLNIFYKEITKKFPQFSKQITIELSENRRFSNSIYITGKKVK